MSPFKLFYNIKKIFFYFLLILNLAFIPSSAISKTVGDKIFIGTTFSLSGENSSASKSFKNKTDKLLKDINQSGGIYAGGKSYNLEIIFYNDESNSIKLNHLLERLIKYDGVQFLIVSEDINLSDKTQNTVNDYNISVVKSNEALWVYKEAFETVDSVNPKQIQDFLLKKMKN
ncbi:transporter substrate-binding protein [Candidatus Pelagibacter sp.]|nr:transporter substrate-binding protein [Candidatus Pelagibacter sp.]